MHVSHSLSAQSNSILPTSSQNGEIWGYEVRSEVEHQEAHPVC